MLQNIRAPQRLDVLDALRGLAVLLVVWYHLWLVSGIVLPFAGPLQLFVESGFLGVDLFFFVSGFCICYPYAKAYAAGRTLPSWREFARRRALKIVPSYLVALLVFAFVYRAKFQSAGDLATSLVAHATFVHVWFPQTFGSLSGPLWTIGVEVQFYVLFALVAAFVVRRPLVAFLGCALIAELYRATLAWTGNDTDFGWINQLPAVLDLFGAGMFAASVFATVAQTRANGAGRAASESEGLAPLRRFARWLDGTSPASRDLRAMQASLAAFVALVFAIVGFSAMTLVERSGGSDAAHRALDATRVAFGPTLAVLALGIVFGAKPMHDAFALAPLRRLSSYSYNAYLWNLELAVGLQALGLAPWAVFAFGAIFTGCFAIVMTEGVERPILEHGSGAFAVVAARVRARAARVAARLHPRPASLVTTARGEFAPTFAMTLERVGARSER